MGATKKRLGILNRVVTIHTTSFHFENSVHSALRVHP